MYKTYATVEAAMTKTAITLLVGTILFISPASAFAAFTLIAVTPSSGSTGVFTVTYSGFSGIGAIMIWTTDAAFNSYADSNMSGDERLTSWTTSSPHSITLATLYASKTSSTVPVPGSGATYIVANVNSVTSCLTTYAACQSGGHITSELDYTLNATQVAAGAPGFVFLSASSSAASVGALGNITSVSVGNAILVTMLAVSVPLAFIFIQEIIWWFNGEDYQGRPRRKKR